MTNSRATIRTRFWACWIIQCHRGSPSRHMKNLFQKDWLIADGHAIPVLQVLAYRHRCPDCRYTCPGFTCCSFVDFDRRSIPGVQLDSTVFLLRLNLGSSLLMTGEDWWRQRCQRGPRKFAAAKSVKFTAQFLPFVTGKAKRYHVSRVRIQKWGRKSRADWVLGMPRREENRVKSAVEYGILFIIDFSYNMFFCRSA
jgi:hypothetical protein